MEYKVKDAKFIRVSDISYMYEIQANGSSVQQHKKAFFYVHLETEYGEGVYILHAAYSKEGVWTRFLIEHEALGDICCICKGKSDTLDIYCYASQEFLRDLFLKVIEHPNVREEWKREKQTL